MDRVLFALDLRSSFSVEFQVGGDSCQWSTIEERTDVAIFREATTGWTSIQLLFPFSADSVSKPLFSQTARVQRRGRERGSDDGKAMTRMRLTFLRPFHRYRGSLKIPITGTRAADDPIVYTTPRPQRTGIESRRKLRGVV